MKLRRSLTVATVVAMGAVALVAASPPAAMSASTWHTFEGSVTGPIENPSGCNNPGATLSMPFAVSGLPTDAPLSGIRLTGVRFDATWVGDLVIQLKSPNGVVAPILGRTGKQTPSGSGASANARGPYTFEDGPGRASWWATAVPLGTGDYVPPGRYRASTIGEVATGGTAISLKDAFASVTDPNGTWTLEATDWCSGDPSAVNAAFLELQSSGDLAGCASYQSALDSASAGLATARTAWTNARTAEQAAADAAGEARGVKNAAGTGLSLAQANATTTDAAVTTAQASVAKATTALKKAKKSKSKPKLAAAKAKLKTAKAALGAAQQAAASADAAVAGIQAALTAATQSLAAKQVALTAAKAAADGAAATVDAGQAALWAAQVELDGCLEA